MIILPLPEFDSDDDMDNFYNSMNTVFTDYLDEMVEGIDRLLTPYGLQLGMYDTGTSECLITVLPL